MSHPAIVDFRRKVNGDPALQREVLALHSAQAEDVVALAARHGYHFSVDDLHRFSETIRNELTDIELELVRGGTLAVGMMGAHPPPSPSWEAQHTKPAAGSSSSSIC